MFGEMTWMVSQPNPIPNRPYLILHWICIKSSDQHFVLFECLKLDSDSYLGIAVWI